MKKGRGTGGLPHASQPILPGLTSTPRSRRLSTPREHALEIARARLVFVTLVFAVAWIVIAGRLSYLTLRGDAPEPQITRAEPGEGVAERADITDRNGTVLATSLPTVSLCADSKSILNPAEAEHQLISVLPDLDEKRLDDALTGGKQCAMIKRHLSPKQYYEVNKLGIAGLEFRPDERRLYPAGNLAAQVVGYTDIDDNGIAGIEKSMDERLNENPEPVALSVDLRVQTIMRQELGAAMNTYHAIGAAGMVLDIKTGEILSMVSLPDFDPDHPGNASDDAKFNRDTLGVYEMGSTFKIFNTALALDSGLVHVADTFDVSQPLEIGHHKIRDFEREDRALNVAEIFTHSSNIGSAKMATRFGGLRQRDFFARLGLTERAKIEVPEVGAPLLPTARDWSDSTTLTAAFGHGIAVNAVQLIGAVATIINDGYPVHPTLVKQNGPAPDYGDDGEERVVSAHTSALVRGLMRLVVTRGTAKQADVEGYMVGGKTGTADKIGANHKYLDNARLSSFIAAFPINAPRYLIFALLDDPKGSAKTKGFATAGWTAAPVVRNVIAQIGPLLDIAPLSKDMQEAAERQILKPLGSEVVDGIPVEEGSNYASVESDSIQ
ncbi:MAG: penicillin-binding protein 2 [Alphaproteobacteria bacterium]|nr:penicillin-binding protein 2 [Alphaproteobacteria bacterium]